MQHAVLRLWEQHWREWEYEQMRMLAVLCQHAVHRWLITHRGSAGGTHTEEAAEYTNALPLILREHESINFFFTLQDYHPCKCQAHRQIH